jgi:hypothetical protein
MNDYTLNVYDEDDNVVKTVTAQFVDLKYGPIRACMKLLNVDEIETNLELLNAVYKAWDKLTNVLNKCFPDMEDDDWDNVKMSELIPTLVGILKKAFAKMMEIPKEKNS